MGPNTVIPVLTNNYGETAKWLIEQNKDNLEQFKYSTNTLHLKDGTRLIMINSLQQLLGLKFTSYIKSPQYWSLEDEAKARCLMYKI